MKKRLYNLIENNTSKSGRLFDISIQLFVIISIISFSLSTIPDLTEPEKLILDSIEFICVILFSIEYVLRIYASPKPFQYIFSFYGVIDLLGVLPFYLGRFVDLRTLRIFRIMRIFRTLKLVRYNKALRRFKIAFHIIHEEMILFGVVTAIMIYLSAVGIYFFESESQPETFSSVFQCLWWAVITLTTVGYGDVYPITLGGKIFTFFVLIIGVGIVTIPAGLVASSLSKAREIDDDISKNDVDQKLK